MWNIGPYQASVNTAPCNCWTWIDTTVNTELRNGNRDWVIQQQEWFGLGGTSSGSVAPQPIPNSLCLTAKPAFFGPNQWPWVDPTTGTTYTLPAKYCFDHNMMPTCLENSTTPVQDTTGPWSPN